MMVNGSEANQHTAVDGVHTKLHLSSWKINTAFMYAIFRSFLLLYPPLDTSFKQGTEGAVLVKATSLHWKNRSTTVSAQLML